MSTQINESLRLNDRTVASGRVVGEWGKLVVDTQAVRLTLHSRHPRVLRDLGYALIDLADDLEVAQRPCAGDEDADRGEADVPTFARFPKETRTFRMHLEREVE